MKVFLAEKFYRQLIEMPQRVQRATMDSVSLFRQDRFANSLNFEKIANAKDSGLRSIRATGKYRIILHESEANTYHVLWVDNHDEAYDWAMHKMFEWNKLTQSYQLYNYVIEEVKEQVTKKTNVAFMATFEDNDLLKIGIPKAILHQVKQINDVDDLERLQPHLPEEVFENIYYLLDKMDIRDIILDIENGLAQEGEEATQSANNRRRFLYVSEDEDLKKHLEGDFELWKVFLHPSQRNLVEKNTKGPMKVTGGAGTGKTVVAMHRIKWLLDNFKFQKAKPIFFTTYTKALTSHLQHNLATLGIDTSRVLVTNLDKFVREQAIKLAIVPTEMKVFEYENHSNKDIQLDFWVEVVENNPTTYSPSFLRDEYRDVILFHYIKDLKTYQRTTRVGRPQRLGRKQRIELWKLFKAYEIIKSTKHYYERFELYNILYEFYINTNEKPFNHVLCDEIQDFSTVQLRLLRALVAESENDMFLVGDPFQAIYSRKISFSKAGINVRGKRSRRLKVNYRTTEEIKQRAVALIKGETYESFEYGEKERINGYVSLLKGEQPTYDCFQSEEVRQNEIVRLIEYYTVENNFKFSDICIAGSTRKNIGVIQKLLHYKNIPYYASSSGKPAYGQKNGVHLSTFHSLKGLEFKIVILIGLSDGQFPFLPREYSSWDKYEQKEYLKSQKSLMYVAMSRAVQRLHLMAVGNKSEWL